MGVALGVALGLRVLYTFWLGPDLLVGDAASYLSAGQDLWAGRPWPAYWPPGLPALLALVTALPGPAWLSAGALMWGFSALFLWQLDQLLRAEGVAPGRRAALLLLMAGYPALIHHGSAPLSHLPVAVAVLGLYAALRRRQGLVGGLWLGAACLIRPASVALLGAVVLILGPRRWRQGLGLLAGLLLMVLPWEAYLYQQTGTWVWINYANSRNLYLGNHPEAPDYESWWLGSHDVCTHARKTHPRYCAEADSLAALLPAARETAYRRLAWSHIGDAPGRFAIRVGHRLRTFWAFDTYAGGQAVQQGRPLGWLLLGLDALCYTTLGLLALRGMWRRRPGAGGWLGLFYLLPYLLAFSHPTYHLPLVGLLALWAGQASEPPPRQTSFYLAGLAFLLIQGEWLLRRLWL
ncbi:MAG: hypothetical protein D6722_17575 [Bacteroidetes bacterium]|nr:MAG: hypothetical protein D6722_17575 [Bacteroidota bacterium]